MTEKHLKSKEAVPRDEGEKYKNVLFSSNSNLNPLTVNSVESSYAKGNAL